MYEVAVLEAGSAEALKRWMDENGYKYPEGMDKVTNDYVDVGWCFVAVKTKVGQKQAVDPKPGQRNVDPTLPDGSVFDGNVQGMGFRFKSDELVVPMRLSAFNPGEMRNVVYLLTQGPRKIRAIPEEYVVRQMSGQQLYENLTQPLPLRIIGGTEADIPEYQRVDLPQRRNPEPKNGVARDLFAADLLAVSTGNLSLEHEEQEKELLRIGEYFGLRGGEIDKENLEALVKARQKTTADGLAMLKGMTMTVVDGDFPREVVAKQNLTFAQYEMPAARNNNLNYDANQFGPGIQKEGTLKVGSVDWQRVHQQIAREHQATRMTLRLVLGMALIGLVFTLVPRKPKLIMLVMLATGILVGTTMADTSIRTSQSDEMLDKLENSKTANEGIEAIKSFAKASETNRDQIVQKLLGVATNDESIPKRGWAIAALAEIGGQDIDEYLLNVHADSRQPQLVRTWAAAARVSMTRTVNGLIEKANLISQFPALGRPIGLRIIEQMSGDEGDQGDPAKILAVTQQVPQLQAALAPAIMAFGSEKLTELMAGGEDNEIRRIAAGYLGALAKQGDSTGVVEQVIQQYQFDSAASEVPWQGGALFVPSIIWSKDDARSLVGNLIRWNLWCELKGKSDQQRQIHNNIRSLGLANAAGYQPPQRGESDASAWLVAWGKGVGKSEIESILEEQNLTGEAKWEEVLSQLN